MPVTVSPLLRSARWSALLLGVVYGHTHNKTVTEWVKEDNRVGAIEAAAAAEALAKKKAEEEAAPSIFDS